MTPHERMALWDDLSLRFIAGEATATYCDYNLRQSFVDWDDEEIDDLVASVRADAHEANAILDLVERLR